MTYHELIESTSLGLSSKVKNTYDQKDSVENIDLPLKPEEFRDLVKKAIKEDNTLKDFFLLEQNNDWRFFDVDSKEWIESIRLCYIRTSKYWDAKEDTLYFNIRKCLNFRMRLVFGNGDSYDIIDYPEKTTIESLHKGIDKLKTLLTNKLEESFTGQKDKGEVSISNSQGQDVPELGKHAENVYLPDCPFMLGKEQVDWFEYFQREKEKHTIKDVDDFIESAKKKTKLIKESTNLGLADKVKTKHSSVNAIDNVSIIHFEDHEIERICHEHGVYTYGDTAKVTSIDDWFRKNNDIKSFNEFKYFTGLNKVEIFAFYECKTLKSITIPYSVTSIGDSAFSYCTPLQTINIPDNVTSIGDHAFAWCESLQSITIPNSVTNIEECAFISCTSLQSINIPNSVINIGEYAFDFCISLQSIIISKNCPVYDKIKKEYPDIKLIEPEVNETISLGLNSKVQKKHKEKDAIDNISGYVDLGLPSGNLWAKCNVGAYSQEQCGEYMLFSDLSSKLKSSLPTIEDFKELDAFCDRKKTKVNGVFGMLFTSKQTRESIFFPYTGFYENGEFNPRYMEKDEWGFYWTPEIYGDKVKFFMLRGPGIDYEKDNVDSIAFPARTIVKNIKEDKQNLGLSKKVSDKHKQKDAIDNISGYVDLGLPSGNLWAKCNVGAFYPEESGGYFCDEDIEKINNQGLGKVPTADDYQELMLNCFVEWTGRGKKFTSIKNGQSVYFPAAGMMMNQNERSSFDRCGYYIINTKNKMLMFSQYTCYLVGSKNGWSDECKKPIRMIRKPR